MTGDKAQTRTIRDNELVSANNPFPEIPVTVPQIIRQAGHRTYQRGVAYQRNREVIRYSYDEDERTGLCGCLRCVLPARFRLPR